MATLKWIVIFMLGVVEVKSQATNNLVIEVAAGKPFSYEMRGGYDKPHKVCTVKTPSRKDPYVLDSTRSVVRNDYINIVLGDVCEIEVLHANARVDTGVWSVYITNGKEEFTENFNVKVVVPTRNVVPKEPIQVVEGQDLFLRFEALTVTNLVECRVNWSRGEVTLRPGNVVDPLVGYWGVGLESECGVQATGMEVEDGGLWRLRAYNMTGHVIEGEFNVTVLPKGGPFDNVVEYIAGDIITLNMGPKNTKYCQIQRPDGFLEEPKISPCSISLGKVSKAHQGNWTARFAVEGQVQEEKTTLSVRIVDSALDLLCHWRTLEYANIKAKYCLFMRPDGMALNMEDGVGNANYVYLGEGINFSNSVKECGLTILTPKNYDVGTWQCIIGVSYQNMLRGGFIDVTSTEIMAFKTQATVKPRVAAKVTGGDNTVEVENQSPLVVSCKATASLSYCWFGHPNGTMLTPSKTGFGYRYRTQGFSYVGRGLDLGECAIKINEASSHDEGVWSCNMGEANGGDLKVLIKVKVANGNIVTSEPSLAVSDDSTFLSCHSIPRGVALTYCRFIRPDGFGFGFKNNSEVGPSRYRYSGPGLERGECGLKISSLSSEDFGMWTCAAMHEIDNREGSTRITLIDKRGMGGGAVTGIVISSIVLVVLIGGSVFYKFKRR